MRTNYEIAKLNSRFRITFWGHRCETVFNFWRLSAPNFGFITFSEPPGWAGSNEYVPLSSYVGGFCSLCDGQRQCVGCGVTPLLQGLPLVHL